MKLSATQLNSLVLLALLSVLGAKPLSINLQGPTDAEMATSSKAPDIVVSTTPAYHPPAVSIGRAGVYTPPDFSRHREAETRKKAFYDYLLPMIHEANREVVRERAWLLGLARRLLDGQALTAGQLVELKKVEKRYAVSVARGSQAERVGRMLLRVDIVPASLVLAQAAKESGWGTSRFAREGNNFFGIWCFFEGCGMTPLHRDEGRDHEVAMFDSVEEGVRYYIRTINTHIAYEELRHMRASARRAQQPVSGEALAGGLVRYSERGLAYVREIQSMIRYNQLKRFTQAYSA
ncbi:MAG: glucosaminidase domain-containing protein [Pseudomonadales bacterium]